MPYKFRSADYLEDRDGTIGFEVQAETASELAKAIDSNRQNEFLLYRYSHILMDEYVTNGEFSYERSLTQDERNEVIGLLPQNKSAELQKLGAEIDDLLKQQKSLLYEVGDLNNARRTAIQYSLSTVDIDNLLDEKRKKSQNISEALKTIRGY
jgi:hypothetical protein